MLFCCDRDSFGNSRIARFGIIARDEHCQVIDTLSVGISITTNYIDECYAVWCVLEWDNMLCARKVLIRPDSKSVISDFGRGMIP